MLKALIVTIFLLPSIAFSQNLIITEVQVRGESSGEAFIKIYNPSSTILDISGFKIRKRSSSGKEYSIRVFPKDSSIPAKGYFVWANSKNDYHLSIHASIWSTATISSNNSIAIFDNDGKVLDSLAWGTGSDQFQKGNPFDQNPGKSEIIKRKVENGVYENSGNNKEDFFIYPEKIVSEIIVPSASEKQSFFSEKNSAFPVFTALMVAISSSLIILSIKKLN